MSLIAVMRWRIRKSRLAFGILAVTALLFPAGVVPAADSLFIDPLKRDFGIVNEGQIAELIVIIENVSNQEVHILGHRTN